mmetsp:Transcript_35110/g.117338  ORF Transcript_35110/g.117338 Transcript_35110/m.117338 type:complete len:334 (+) Transcript_35110:132-1133(+)
MRAASSKRGRRRCSARFPWPSTQSRLPRLGRSAPQPSLARGARRGRGRRSPCPAAPPRLAGRRRATAATGWARRARLRWLRRFRGALAVRCSGSAPLRRWRTRERRPPPRASSPAPSAANSASPSRSSRAIRCRELPPPLEPSSPSSPAAQSPSFLARMPAAPPRPPPPPSSLRVRICSGTRAAGSRAASRCCLRAASCCPRATIGMPTRPPLSSPQRPSGEDRRSRLPPPPPPPLPCPRRRSAPPTPAREAPPPPTLLRSEAWSRTCCPRRRSPAAARAQARLRPSSSSIARSRMPRRAARRSRCTPPCRSWWLPRRARTSASGTWRGAHGC